MIRRLTLGALTLALSAVALAVLGTFLPGLPYLGLATGFVPPVMSWVVLGAALSAALTLVLCWRRRNALPVVLVATALAIAVGGSIVTGRMVSAVENAGADVDLVDTLGVWRDESSTPDAQATYSTFGGAPLGVSVYRPSSGSRGAPVLVFIHGGGWVAGDRDARSADMRWFADRGWLTITVSYPLSSADRHLWDVVQGELGCALVWVADHAGDYGGDPARLSLTGASAGGNLAINTAYLVARGELESSCGGEVPAVSAVAAAYPVVDPADFYSNEDAVLGDTSRKLASAYTGGTPGDRPDRYAAISSFTHLSAAAPPTLLYLGADDHLVPVGPTLRFAAAARAEGVDVDLVSVPYADHVFDARTGSIGQQGYRQLTAQWLRGHGQAP